MNSQTVLTQGVGMTDNNSYGRLQLWAVTIPYKSLQLRSKISVEGRERLSHNKPCGKRAKDLAKILLARDRTAFTPIACSSKMRVNGYFAMNRDVVQDQRSLLSI